MIGDRYRGFFRTKTRDSFAVAMHYLQGLVQAPRRNLEEMAVVVEGGDAQRFQHFISNSPWDERPVMAQIARDADGLLGGRDGSCLILDETSFAKKGEHSVGVARQWCGRLGKVENCQVTVFAALSDGVRHTLIDTRLYLPKSWVEDPERCAEAGIPVARRVLRSKSELALEMVRTARAAGIRFGWVGADGGYGKEPAFLRGLDDMGETFVVDVHRNQTVWLADPGLHIPPAKTTRGRQPRKMRAAEGPTTAEAVAAAVAASHWSRLALRDATRGPLKVDVAVRRVWLWDGTEAAPRCWHLIMRREVGSPKTLKYTLSNAPVDTPVLRLAQMQGQRFWIERALEDAKSSCGMDDYQVLGWRAWHHHVTMVMLALLFILEQRIAENDTVDLLSPADIVAILKAMLPANDPGPEAVIRRINRSHQKRHSSIRSRFLATANSPP